MTGSFTERMAYLNRTPHPVTGTNPETAPDVHEDLYVAEQPCADFLGVYLPREHRRSTVRCTRCGWGADRHGA